RLSFATALRLVHREKEAVEQVHKALELAPQSLTVHQNAGLAYVASGMFPEAIAEFQQSGKDREAPYSLAMSGFCYAKLGNRAKALEIREQIAQRTRGPALLHDNWRNLAIIQLALGETDAVFESLERAYETTPPSLIDLITNPV